MRSRVSRVGMWNHSVRKCGLDTCSNFYPASAAVVAIARLILQLDTDEHGVEVLRYQPFYYYLDSWKHSPVQWKEIAMTMQACLYGYS